jgi:DNA-binding response OmpR family regulator
MMSELILVVEDEISLRETLVYNLQNQGYQVESARDGNEAIDQAVQMKPDLILLDIMLPGIDGFEVCRILRQSLNVPIIFLTARDDEIDRVIGLEIGGDDYISKPFSMRELISRVKARLRMTRLHKQQADVPQIESQDAQQVFQFDNLTIDEKRREITLDGNPIAYKPKEYDLLVFLAKRVRQMVTREEILNQVWNYDFLGDSRTIDVHIHWLREKIEKDPANPTRIVTVRGGGYRFEG